MLPGRQCGRAEPQPAKIAVLQHPFCGLSSAMEPAVPSPLPLADAPARISKVTKWRKWKDPPFQAVGVNFCQAHQFILAIWLSLARVNKSPKMAPHRVTLVNVRRA